VVRCNEHGNQHSGSIKRGEFLDYRASGNTARGIPYCPNFFLFILPDQRLHIVKNMCTHTHTHTHLSAYRLYMHYRRYQVLPHVKHFHANREWCEVLTGIYHCSFDLGVTGRTRNIGQNVLPSSFRTGSSSSPSYRHILFLLAFLEEAFVRNITIMLYINYITH